MQHIPVLLSTVLDVLHPQEGESVLDVTIGLGGHAEAFLQKIGKSGHLTGLDADSTNLAFAKERLAAYERQSTFIHTNFSHLRSFGATDGQANLETPRPNGSAGRGNSKLGTFDIIFADLGVSSPHFDDPERGFSFRFDGPLDLRYDRADGLTAAELITASEPEPLAGIFCDYGELVREAGRLGRGLAGNTYTTTTALAQEVEKLFGYKAKQILPRVFQALRIAVNDEMGALRSFLDVAPQLVRSGGRIGVLSYHSLEDRMVKQTFRHLCEPVRDDLTGQITVKAPFESLTHKAIQADEIEVAENQRSRSVRFRAVRKTE